MDFSQSNPEVYGIHYLMAKILSGDPQGLASVYLCLNLELKRKILAPLRTTAKLQLHIHQVSKMIRLS